MVKHWMARAVLGRTSVGGTLDPSDRPDAAFEREWRTDASEALRRRGYKPEQVFAELGADFAALKEAGALELMEFVMRRGATDAANPAATTVKES